jgi:hypothetical protein
MTKGKGYQYTSDYKGDWRSIKNFTKEKFNLLRDRFKIKDQYILRDHN